MTLGERKTNTEESLYPYLIDVLGIYVSSGTVCLRMLCLHIFSIGHVVRKLIRDFYYWFTNRISKKVKYLKSMYDISKSTNILRILVHQY